MAPSDKIAGSTGRIVRRELDTSTSILSSRSRFPLQVAFTLSRKRVVDVPMPSKPLRFAAPLITTIEIARERKSYRRFRSGVRTRGKERGCVQNGERCARTHPASDDTHIEIYLAGKMSPDTFPTGGGMLLARTPSATRDFFSTTPKERWRSITPTFEGARLVDRADGPWI